MSGSVRFEEKEEFIPTSVNKTEEVDLMILPDEIPVFKRCFFNSEEMIKNYKAFGPANPQVNEGVDDEHFRFCPFSDDGICYMLTCNCVNDDPDVPNKNWYTGKCMFIDDDGKHCPVVFDSKIEAWRTPLDNGGFNGCFCRNHFRRNIPRPEDKEHFSLFHTLCDIMIMIRERYPIQEINNVDSGIEIYYEI